MTGTEPNKGLAAAGAAAGTPPAPDGVSANLGHPGGPLAPSVRCFDLIKQFEGYARALPDGRCQAYPDPGTGGDPWTIGYGSTGPTIKKGVVWTRQQAEERLEADVIRFAGGVAAKLEGGAATSQNELDAMVSLAYNIGLGNFEKSSVLRFHRAGDKARAADSFAMWNKANHKEMAGLTRRRAAEAALYRGAAA